MMKTILVLVAASVALLSGCVVADRDGYRDGYYSRDGRVEHDRDHWDHDHGDHRGNDRDHWQGGPRY